MKKEAGLKTEVRNKFVILVTSAFGLVAALAWNSAIQELFREILVDFFGTSMTLVFRFLYAVIVTILAVYITIWVSKLSKEPEKNK